MSIVQHRQVSLVSLGSGSNSFKRVMIQSLATPWEQLSL